MTDLPVKMCRVNKAAKLPSYATEGSVGLDIQTMVDVRLYPGQSMRVTTGVAVAIPIGYEAQLRPRSSTSGKSTLVHLGTVDGDFRGEMLLNLTYLGADGWYEAKAGERIAQMVIAPVPHVIPIEVESKEELGATERGDRGFGSSGV